MSSGDLLPHGSEEALRVEETSHPEHVGSPSEDPSMELGIPLQKFSKPEPKSGGLPRHLHTHNERGREHLADVNYVHCFSGIKPPPLTHTHTHLHILSILLTLEVSHTQYVYIHIHTVICSYSSY